MNDFAYASNVFARHAATAFVSLRLDARGFVVGQRVGDDVFAFEKQFFEFVHDVSIVRGEETHGGTLASAATRATDAVRVVFDGVRQLVVDDEIDVFHVDTATGDVGGDENVEITSLEPAQGLFALVLRFAAVYGRARVSEAVAQVGHGVDGTLGVDEDYGLRVGVSGQDELEL